MDADATAGGVTTYHACDELVRELVHEHDMQRQGRGSRALRHIAANHLTRAASDATKALREELALSKERETNSGNTMLHERNRAEKAEAAHSFALGRFKEVEADFATAMKVLDPKNDRTVMQLFLVSEREVSQLKADLAAMTKERELGGKNAELIARRLESQTALVEKLLEEKQKWLLTKQTASVSSNE